MITLPKNSKTLPEWICQETHGWILKLWIQPGAKRSEIVGPYGTPPRLKVKIQSPPVDGAANDEIIHFFSTLLKAPKKNLSFIRGLTSRQKDLLIVGSQIEDILNAIEGKLNP